MHLAEWQHGAANSTLGGQSNGMVLEVGDRVYELDYAFKLNMLKLACWETGMNI